MSVINHGRAMRSSEKIDVATVSNWLNLRGGSLGGKYRTIFYSAFYFLLLMLITACFDKGGGSKGGAKPEISNPPGVTSTDDPGTSGKTPSPSKKSLSPPNILVAQTHLIPTGGLRWPETKANPELIVAANRETLVTVNFIENDVANPALQLWRDTELAATLALNPPSTIPTSEGGDSAPEENMWHAYMPAEFVKNGLSLSVSSNNYIDTPNQEILVGPETTLTYNFLPFFLFGATETNTGKNFDEERLLTFTEELMKEAAAGLPASHTIFKNHPAQGFVSDFLVMPPRDGKAAFTAFNDAPNLFKTINMILNGIHTSGGDSPLNNFTYASIIAIDNSKSGTNKFKPIGGGLSSIDSGTGIGGNGETPFGYLWHEGGHGLGMGHSPEEYRENWYPYEGGSLKGSSWGFNSYHKEFRPALIPPTARIFESCRASGKFQKNDDNRCYRFDPMHDATNNGASNNNFPLYSDYNAARIQSWLKKRKKIDPSSPTNFARWDNTTKKWIPHTPVTNQYGAWSINENLPVILSNPVVRINVNYSKAGTPNVSRFYPPMYSVENSIKFFDPLDRIDMDSIYPTTRKDGSTPPYQWYCHTGGCDYSVRVTFSDGTVAYRLLKGGFRKHSYPEEFDSDINDPLSEKSFKFWPVIIPRAADARATKLELLETPKAWSLTADEVINAAVLISESF